MKTRRCFNRPIGSVHLLAACLALMPTAVVAASEVARPADAFVDSIGVGVHAHYFDTAYGNWSAVEHAIADIGIRNVRSGPYAADRLNALTARSGVRINVVIDGRTTGSGRLNPSAIPELLGRARTVQGIRWIEGPNEYDLNNRGDSEWAATLLDYQTRLYNQVKNDRVLGPTGRNVSVIAPSVLWWNARRAPDLTGVADLGNMHSYPAGLKPSNGLHTLNIPAASRIVRGKPLVSTETGYHTAVNMPVGQAQPGVSEAAMAKYVPRLFMEYFNAGVQQTFEYELLDEWPDPQKDESEKNFGLLRNDYSYKPAATALKNTISLLRDPGPEFRPGILNYSIAGGNRDLHHSLLQKRDGDFFLALWQEVSSYDANARREVDVADQPITLTLNTPIAQAATYLPNDSLLPTATYGPISQLNLEVPDRLLLVRLTPVPEPGVAGLLGLGVAVLLMRRRRQRSHSSLCVGSLAPQRPEAPASNGTRGREPWAQLVRIV